MTLLLAASSSISADTYDVEMSSGENYDRAAFRLWLPEVARSREMAALFYEELIALRLRPRIDHVPSRSGGARASLPDRLATLQEARGGVARGHDGRAFLIARTR